jgi:UDP-N-acetylglucosamine 2-epimerase (non-hydrolysing)
LRTGDNAQPFPEEVNRRVCSVMADVHFSPTQQAAANLRAEGILSSRIIVTGNTVIDALRQVSAMPFDSAQWGLNGAGAEWEGKRLVLVTAHRRENFGPPLEGICQAIREIGKQRSDSVHFVYPVHLNPQVQEPVGRLLGGLANVTLLPPLEYLPLVHLLKRSYLVMTDSGGLQEEAPGLGKPVLVLREVTERPEGVAAGTVKLVGTDTSRIVPEVLRLLDDAAEYRRMSEATNPYGDGFAASRISSHLDEHTI